MELMEYWKPWSLGLLFGFFKVGVFYSLTDPNRLDCNYSFNFLFSLHAISGCENKALIVLTVLSK